MSKSIKPYGGNQKAINYPHQLHHQSSIYVCSFVIAPLLITIIERKLVSIYSGISPTVRLLSSLLPLYMYQVQMTAVSGIILIFLTFLREEDPEGSTNEAWLLEF